MIPRTAARMRCQRTHERLVPTRGAEIRNGRLIVIAVEELRDAIRV
jgi:hypothetical protein